MDTSTRPAGQPGLGLLEAVVGQGFAAALQDGLSRTASPHGGAARGTRRRAEAAHRPAGPVEGVHSGPPRDGTPGVPTLPEAGAILRRFEERLLTLAEPGHVLDPDSPAARAACLAYARRVLADAREIAGGRAVSPAPLGPGLPSLAPSLTAAVGTLLIECAVQHTLARSGPAATGSHMSALVQSLGEALRRHSAASAGTPSAHDAVWRERRRLAQEMHDELGAHLSLALHHLTMETGHAKDPTGHLTVVAASVRSALGHTRDLITGLREETAVPPLREAVEAFAAQAAPGGARVTFSATGNESLVPDAWRRELFLAVRECLRNCFAHAQARTITVTSRVTRQWTHVSVTDDGVGFVTTAPSREQGQGLRSAAERVEDLGGRFTLVSTPGQGTRVDLHVPLRVRP
ncbi:ATP-binding protein [Streptomyces sp. Edi4]|uniref:sensor histidine kinase n=1 Tax=Streptomyces sp. Edi4 TaxID=3162527 RepID=UPI003305CDBE